MLKRAATAPILASASAATARRIGLRPWCAGGDFSIAERLGDIDLRSCRSPGRNSLAPKFDSARSATGRLGSRNGTRRTRWRCSAATPRRACPAAATGSSAGSGSRPGARSHIGRADARQIRVNRRRRLPRLSAFRRVATRCNHGFGQHLRLTQQELAVLVGASRPVVSTILNKFRDKGVLGYNREYVCVRGIEEIAKLIDS